MKPDLVINGLTSMDDIIELHESGKTELYTLETILAYFKEIGLGQVSLTVLKTMLEDSTIG